MSWTRKNHILTGSLENRLASIKLAQQYIEKGESYEQVYGKVYWLVFAPSLLMACGDATELENAEVESELNGTEVEESEQGLTFAPLSDAGMLCRTSS